MSKAVWGEGMEWAASVERYRSYAAKCVKLSNNIPDPASKLVLLEMAQSWLKLAEQAMQRTEEFVGAATVPNAPPSE